MGRGSKRPAWGRSCLDEERDQRATTPTNQASKREKRTRRAQTTREMRRGNSGNRSEVALQPNSTFSLLSVFPSLIPFSKTEASERTGATASLSSPSSTSTSKAHLHFLFSTTPLLRRRLHLRRRRICRCSLHGDPRSGRSGSRVERGRVEGRAVEVDAADAVFVGHCGGCEGVSGLLLRERESRGKGGRKGRKTGTYPESSTPPN